uniref:SAM domain-containing protein n=1 Tax=Trichuris muris TaxID=70415 RepID=A0A5S6QWT3_TRIMR
MCGWSQPVDRPVRLPLSSYRRRWPLNADRYCPPPPPPQQSPTCHGFRPLSSLSPGSSSTSSNGGGTIGESFLAPSMDRHHRSAMCSDPTDAVTHAMSMLNVSSLDDPFIGHEELSYPRELATSRRAARLWPSDTEENPIDPYLLNCALNEMEAGSLGATLVDLLPCITFMTPAVKQVYVSAIKRFVGAVFSNQVGCPIAIKVFLGFANHPSLFPDVRTFFRKLIDLLTGQMNPVMRCASEMNRCVPDPMILGSCRMAAARCCAFTAEVQHSIQANRRISPIGTEGGRVGHAQAREPFVDYAARRTVGAARHYSGMNSSLPTNRGDEEQYPGEDIFTFMSLFNSRNVPSEGCAQQGATQNEADRVPAGMRDVPHWLKILRLHKYARLFVDLSYQEMLSLNENSSRFRTITSGARRKLSLSIERLRLRAATLKEMEMGGFLKSGGMMASLTELKAISESPICPYREIVGNVEEAKVDGFDLLPDEVDDRNIPAHLTRVLGKACTQLKAFSELDEESISMCSEILERCMAHEAFTCNQKKRLSAWKLELRRAWCTYKKNVAEQRLIMSRSVRGRRGCGPSNQTHNNVYHEPTTGIVKRDFGRFKNRQNNQRSNASGYTGRAPLSWCNSNGRADRRSRRQNQTEAQRYAARAKNCVGKVPSNQHSNTCYNDSPKGDHRMNDESMATVGRSLRSTLPTTLPTTELPVFGLYASSFSELTYGLKLTELSSFMLLYSLLIVGRQTSMRCL